MSEPIHPFKSAEGEAHYRAAYEASLGLWPFPCRSRDVITPYGLTHINLSGSEDAFPLILLHGGYASSTMWFPNAADLSAEYYVLAPDMIGEPGMSLPSRTNATCQDCAAWLVGLLDALRIAKAHVVGLSRGGWLALNLAIHAPGRVAGIGLLSPAASFIPLKPFFRAVAAATMRIPNRSALRAALYTWVAPGFRIHPVYTEQFILGLKNWDWQTNKNGYSGVMPAAFGAEELSGVHSPVLMLTGDHDRLNPPSTIGRAKGLIPQLEGEVIANAGHMLSMEQPAQVDARILKFLAGVNRN